MNMMNAFEPFSKSILRISKSVRQLLFYNGVFCILGNVLLADEMAQIVTIGPIIKQMTDNNVDASEEDMYRIRLRNATFSDAMACFILAHIRFCVQLVHYYTCSFSLDSCQGYFEDRKT
jgi:NhaC family Na+:H+ antiporter